MDAVTFPSHRHPLNYIELLSGKEVCRLCGKELINGSAYECSQCNFTAHLDCAKNPPSTEIKKSKIHEHTLTLLPRYVSFNCNACGLLGVKSPYVCLECSFMVHRDDCINLPHLIKISRHEHRLFHTCFLGPGEWYCGVCRQKIDGKYGAYHCSKGCLYAVHSLCATRGDVWDSTNLKGEEEEDHNELVFSPGDYEELSHFSHEHSLKLEDQGKSDVVCSICALPITFETFYRCDRLCDFFLHKRCAALPRMKQMFLHVHPVTLCTEDERSEPNGLSRCVACDLHFSGFRYRCFPCDIEFDVRCSSVSEPFDYYLHDHPLFFILPTKENEEAKICTVCNHQVPKYVLSCVQCDFKLCFACATLPDKVIYKYDDHLLSHTISEDDTTNPYWCDICENKIEEMRSHYTCHECGPVLHTECVLGSFRNMRPGFSFTTKDGHKYEVILNDRTSLLRCSQCHKDCNEPLLLMSTTTTTTTDATIYLCSSPCFRAYVSV